MEKYMPLIELGLTLWLIWTCLCRFVFKPLERMEEKRLKKFRDEIEEAHRPFRELLAEMENIGRCEGELEQIRQEYISTTKLYLLHKDGMPAELHAEFAKTFSRLHDDFEAIAAKEEAECSNS